MAAKNGTGSKTATKRNTKRPPAPTSTETVATTSTTTPAPTTPTTDVMTAASTVAETRNPSRDEIARRAFELFIARGREHGRAQEDWLKAERELRDRYSVS